MRVRTAALAVFVAVAACKQRQTMSEVESAPRSPDRPGEPGGEGRTNPSHFEGAFVVDGDYGLEAPKIAQRYGGVAVQRFGAVEPMLDETNPVKDLRGNKKLVRDMHYHLGQGRVGIRPVPVMDTDHETGTDEEAQTADGKAVKGSEVIDAFLRKTQNLGDSDPVFALIAYMHPEFFKGTIADLAKTHLKLENGQTHLGLYIGQGRTRNAPSTYHRRTWGLRQGANGYPANVSIVALSGVDQKTLNLNGIVATKLLNELNGGTRFPANFKFDHFRAVNLKETLDYFRGWVDKDWVRPGESEPYSKKLLDDDLHKTYCAEHVTIALNVALNVPQNETGYVSVWGEEDGKKLWALASQRYRTEADETMPVVADFVPLWKANGITEPTKTMELGKSLAWPAETTADLIANFVEQYAAWPDVGAVTSATVVLGFAGQAMERMGIDLPTFLQRSVPLLTKMFSAEASTRPMKAAANPGAAYDAYTDGVKAALTRALTGLAQQAHQQPAPLIATVVPAVEAELRGAKAGIIANDPESLEKAWDLYRDGVKREMEAARATPVKSQSDVAAPGAKYVQYYTPPAVVHRITSAIHPSDPKVTILTVATAMAADELRAGAARSYDVNAAAP